MAKVRTNKVKSAASVFIGVALAAMSSPASAIAGEASRLATDLGTTASQSVALRPVSPPLDGPEDVAPKSGINFVLYNNGMEVVKENTGVLLVEDRINKIQTLATDKLVMQESGFIEIFANNDAQTPVYFDNMTVTHTPGRVLEVNTYYPYGMLIPELSAKAATKDEQNWYKFSSKELETALNLGWYDFHTRPYAPVIGKFLTPDPHAENYYSMSPYAYTGNNPVNNIDPTGMDWYSWLEKYREEDIKEIQTRTRYMYVEGTMSQKEMDEGGYTHVGESFFGWNDAGNRQSWNVDGTTTDLGPNRLSGVTITGKMSEHARLMSSPGVQAVHQGHEEFINELGDFFTMLGNVLTYGSFSAPPPEHRLVTGTAPTPGRFKGGGSIKGGKLFQKMGRAKGNMSGNHAVQNEQARAIVKALGVNNDPDKVRQIHDYISGMGWGYQEALQEVKYFLNIK